MSQPKIAIIGECMIELSEKAGILKRGFGGDTLNTAVYLARQTTPALDVYYVSALGVDAFSQQMLAAWQQEGIKTDLVQQIPDKLPGLYFIETDDTGERTFSYWRNDAAARYWLQHPLAEQTCQQLVDFDYIYLSGISIAILDPASRQQLLTVLQQCRQRGGKVIFDNNYRPRLWQQPQQTQQAYRDVLSCTDIAFLTLDDEDLLWGQQPLEQVIERTRKLGVGEIIIKRGADACLVITADESIAVPAVKLAKNQVVDTTAAGDSFSAGYLARRLMGGAAQDAAYRGHITASTVIQYSGAIIPLTAMPTFND